MLHINYFPKFFVLTLQQAATRQLYFDQKLRSELEGSAYRVVSKNQAEFGAEITEIFEALKAERGELHESTKRK